MAIQDNFYINAKGDVPAADFAYTMAPKGAGARGSTAVPWIKTGLGGTNLPEEIRKLIYGGTGTPGAYDPFAQATGYAIDPATGQIIIRTGEGGAMYAEAFAPGVGSGKSIQMNMSSISGGEDSTTTGGTSSTSGIGNLPSGVTVVSTFSDPTTGDVTATLSDGTTRVLAKSGTQSATKKSAYDLLYQQFNDLGIGGLVPELKTFIEEGVSPSEFTLRLRSTDAYKKRFAANAQRINKGLRALSEAEYIGLEDRYQDVMQRYGLPGSYYSRGEMGRQEGFEKFISGDVSPAELEDRISTAQKRVINANPEVAQALKTFYPGISNGDILAYTLDPSKAIEDIKRKVTAAEIGGAAVRAGLTTSAADAEYLQRYGVTKEQADQGYQAAAQIVPRASQLADIYKQGPYTQATAEQEIFNLPGQVEAQKQRKKLTELETSAFSGRAGVGAIARDRAGVI
jgi:hypothetical protein